MKLTEIEQFWPILEAFKAGKTIQTLNSIANKWTDAPTDGLIFNMSPDKYRIKPEETILYSQVLKEESSGSFFFGNASRQKEITYISNLYPIMGHNKMTLLENKIVSTVFEPLEE